MGMGGNMGGRIPQMQPMPQQLMQQGMRATTPSPLMQGGQQGPQQVTGGSIPVGERAPWLPQQQPSTSFQFRPHQQLGMGAMPMPPQRPGMPPPGPSGTGGPMLPQGPGGAPGMSSPEAGSTQDRLAQQQQLAEQLRQQGLADAQRRQQEAAQAAAAAAAQAEAERQAALNAPPRTNYGEDAPLAAADPNYGTSYFGDTEDDGYRYRNRGHDE